MAREQTYPKDEHWNHFYTTAQSSTKFFVIYTWTCPNCGAPNTTIIDTSSAKDRCRCYRGVEARCGRCHGNVLRLTDERGLTLDPFALP
jgi:hypothetical protein